MVRELDVETIPIWVVSSIDDFTDINPQPAGGGGAIGP